METAIPFIVSDENHRWVVTDDAHKALDTVQAPLAVISIVGVYRSGKSFLLNNLSGSCRPFTVGSTVRPCTQGIMMFIVPPCPENNNTTVLLLDTEGMSSTERDVQFDTLLFCLCTLLSSHIVYNSKGCIDEKSIQDLQLVTHMTQHIHVHSHAAGDEESGTDFSLFFPYFTWVVRDFALQLDGTTSAVQYLEDCLRNQPGHSQAIATKNQTRTLIREFFRHRHCYLLPRPVADETQLQQQSVALSQLRPEFSSKFEDLRQHILGQPRTKVINGQAVNGSILAGLAVLYTKALNGGAAPVIMDSWESVVELQSQRARQQGQAEYENYISNTDNLSLPVSHSKLVQICAAAKLMALSTFDSICVVPNSRLRNLLKQHINDRTHALREQNLEVSRILAHRDALSRWHQLKEQFTTTVAALEAVIGIGTSVSMSDQGPGVWEGLGQFTIDVMLPEMIAITQRFEFETSRAHDAACDALLSDITAARIETQEAVHKIEELKHSNEQLLKLRDRLIAEKADSEESCATVKAHLHAQSRELQSLQVSSDSAKEILLQQLDESLQKNTSYAAQVHMLETDLRAAREKESDFQSCLQTLHTQHRQKEGLLSAQVNAAAAELQTVTDDYHQARSREEDLRVECAVLKERLRNASDAASADMLLIQRQLDAAVSKARVAAESRDALESAMSQHEQEHSEALRMLTIQSSQRENALESKIFQQAQVDASNRQQLQDKTDRGLELERKLQDIESLHLLLMREHSSLVQVHEATRTELDILKRANEELKSQHDHKMQLLLQESTQNQQQLHELQQSLQREQIIGQDAILAGTEVLQELARLKLEIEDEAHDKKVATAKVSGKAAKPKSSLPLFARRDSLKFQPLSSPQTPPR